MPLPRLVGTVKRHGPLSSLSRQQHLPDMYGTIGREVESVQAGDWTVKATDLGRVIPFDCGALARTATLPLLSTVDDGFMVGFMRVTGSNVLTVRAHATDGSGTVALPGNKITWAMRVNGAWRQFHAGEVLQRYLATDATFASTSATTPALDDTIPQITEGFALHSTTFTPVSSASLLRFIALITMGASAGMTAALSLFVAGAADAVATSAVSLATDVQSLTLRHDANSPGAGVATAVQWRCGKEVAGTLYFNGLGGSRKYGGTLAARFLIEEYLR